MIALELNPCAGGMAEGFRRAGITFAWSFDWDPDACASYERNLGHAPIRMDIRDLVRLARTGWRHFRTDTTARPPYQVLAFGEQLALRVAKLLADSDAEQRRILALLEAMRSERTRLSPTHLHTPTWSNDTLDELERRIKAGA